MTNEREAAQETKQDGATETTTIVVLIDVVGEIDMVRGFQFRGMRPATVDDLQRELERLQSQTPTPEMQEDSADKPSP